MAIYNQRIKFSKQQLAESYQRKGSLSDIVYGIIRFLGILVQNLYCVSSYLVLSWIVFIPISWLRLDLYSRVENCLYNSLLFIVSSWSMAAGITVVETGDEYKHLIEGPEHQQQLDNRRKLVKAREKNRITTIPTMNGELKNGVNGDTLSRAFISNANIDEVNYGYNFDRKTGQRTPRVLLLCNHISTADVPLMMQSFSTLTNQSVLWVLDALFKITQFGLVCSSHGDFFVAKNSFIDGTLRDQVIRHPDRNLLVLFPEGGFLRKRIDGSNRYALRNNLPETKYVTHPRFGAFKDLMDPSVGITHIVDTTLMYDNIKDPLSILNIIFGNRREPAILHYKIYEREKINPSDEWLRSIWIEKDKLLEKYYNDRDSVLKLVEGTMRASQLDWYKLLSVHLFYILVCYLTIYRLFSATNILMLTAKDLYYSNI